MMPTAAAVAMAIPAVAPPGKPGLEESDEFGESADGVGVGVGVVELELALGLELRDALGCGVGCDVDCGVGCKLEVAWELVLELMEMLLHFCASLDWASRRSSTLHFSSVAHCVIGAKSFAWVLLLQTHSVICSSVPVHPTWGRLFSKQSSYDMMVNMSENLAAPRRTYDARSDAIDDLGGSKVDNSKNNKSYLHFEKRSTTSIRKVIISTLVARSQDSWEHTSVEFVKSEYSTPSRRYRSREYFASKRWLSLARSRGTGRE
jgi:hypothetical protein